MTCLLDTNVVVLLAEFNLLQELTTTLGISQSDLKVPVETPCFLKYGAGGKVTSDALGRAQSFVKTIDTFDPPIDPIEQITLASAKLRYHGKWIKIDPGEQVLFAGTKNLSDYLILTHDKNCLRVLEGCPTCHAIRDRLRGRVICLEQLLLRAIDKHGYAKIQNRVSPVCRLDTLIERAFGFGSPQHPKDECANRLAGYVNDLRAQSDGLLQS